MSNIRTKFIKGRTPYCEDGIDDKINEFIDENKDIKIIDIKFTSSNNKLKALIIYEVEDNER